MSGQEQNVGSGRRARTEGFRALGHADYRLYLGGMLFRGTAVWMQLVSLPWLAVELGAGPAELGLVVGLQFLPTLVISPLGGVLADRMDRSRVLTITQIGSALQGLGLFWLASSGAATIPALLAFAFSFGVLTAIELPVRQAYLTELVPSDAVSSAVSLHSTAWNTTRFIGPGLAGIIIATLGVAASFLVSAVMAALVAISILWLERHRFHPPRQAQSTSGVLSSLSDGAKFASGEPQIRWALILVTAGGIFGIQSFQTLAPLYVSDALGLGGGAYGAFVAVWGGGAVAASYVVTLMAHGDRRIWLVGGAAGLSLLLAFLAWVGSAPVAFAAVVLLGFAQISLAQNAMVTVQIAAPDEMRGRVMGLYTTVFQGTGPFGAFIAGWLGSVIGVRWAMFAMALVLGVIAGMAAVALRHARQAPTTPALSPDS